MSYDVEIKRAGLGNDVPVVIFNMRLGPIVVLIPMDELFPKNAKTILENISSLGGTLLKSDWQIRIIQRGL